MSAQSSPVKAAFLLPHAAAVDVDLILGAASTAYLAKRCRRTDRVHIAVNMNSQFNGD